MGADSPLMNVLGLWRKGYSHRECLIEWGDDERASLLHLEDVKDGRLHDLGMKQWEKVVTSWVY